MKIEKLNENKIKITFNIDDLAEKNIDLYSFMHNTPETQDLFWDILNEAEKECGFNVDNSMIYVEATTTGSGNFTLIVTKTSEKPYNTNRTLTKRKSIKLKRKTTSLKSQNNIYQFDSFDDVCEFVKIIDTSVLANNSLYSMNHKYYLKTAMMPYNSILEYAAICSSPYIVEAKINEYGSLIIKDSALQTIDTYFNKRINSKRSNNKKRKK
ncbi:MAG: adaptor protein MecA [Clostridia bacterium]|nr:adaptor protein MecA [Clostridia bacterium]